MSPNMFSFPHPKRRELLSAIAGAVVSGTAVAGMRKAKAAPSAPGATPTLPTNEGEPFCGVHQSGIVTFPIQHHTLFATFDLLTATRGDLADLLRAWTLAAARMTAGETAQALGSGLTLAVAPQPQGDPKYEYRPDDFRNMSSDTGETIGMSPARLTITFGFGAGVFVKDGQDRYGLAHCRPPAFVDMPGFIGDQLIEQRTGGDISVQACAEDPQVAFHAVRQLARIAEGIAKLRWVQSGFRPSTGERHLLGFSNGKGNPPMTDPAIMNRVVWIGDEGPAWLHGGTYLVTRRIRFAIEHWDHMPVAYQEEAIGEEKYAHPPPPGTDSAAGSDDASSTDDEDQQNHLRVVTPDRFTMLRRSYSYNDGLNVVAERWPPWRQGLEYDAGMFFICYQRDPRTGFIAMYDKMAKYDAQLNQFWTHTGGGLFVCPRGAGEGEFVGQDLLAAA